MIETKTYSKLRELSTLEERFDYLKLSGSVGSSTFGFDRFLNQQFYHSTKWKRLRDIVIIRDNGCDLGVPGYEITYKIIIHHMNPVEVDDFVKGNSSILDPEFLICVAHRTHLAIHYGDTSLLPQLPTQRRKGDTNLW
jgi:hypothetical protein